MGLFDSKQYQSDPRDYALDLAADGMVSADNLLVMALVYMSHDEVRDMLDTNELSPRFNPDTNDDDK